MEVSHHSQYHDHEIKAAKCNSTISHFIYTLLQHVRDVFCENGLSKADSVKHVTDFFHLITDVVISEISWFVFGQKRRKKLQTLVHDFSATICRIIHASNIGLSVFSIALLHKVGREVVAK